MQVQFRNELNAVNAGIKARKGTPLTSFTRAENIARNSRTITKLDVTSQIDADNLVKFTKYAKFLGDGLAMIEFGSRVGNIHNSYKSGGNWEREMFIESSSFAASATTGIVAVKVGGAALTAIIAAASGTWILLIIGGVAVAGAAAVSSGWINNIVKNNAGGAYDYIMELVDKIL